MSYYNRIMSPEVMSAIADGGFLHWIIDYVRDNPELDFQTGADNKGRSWFSVYRVPSRVFTYTGGKAVKANKYYTGKWPEFYSCPTKENFKVWLNKVRNEKNWVSIISTRREKRKKAIIKI